MSGFAQTSLTVKTWDGHNIVLGEPLTYVSDDGDTITVATGSTSDGASTPRGIWAVMPPFGLGWPAYVLHDFLYRCTQLAKARCDDLLLEALLSLGVGALRAKVIYLGVKLGGASAFAADRAAQTVMHLKRVTIT